jgi:general L-amino acid transport system substrate-binding protein
MPLSQNVIANAQNRSAHCTLPDGKGQIIRIAVRIAFLCISVAVVTASTALRAQTLARIRAAKTLRCATISEIPEYSSTDDHGPRTAFDADLCRAVAIAILGRNAQTTTTTYPDDVAATAALHAHKVDLIPTLTLDLTHSADSRVSFTPPLLYDGVGFLVPAATGSVRPAELSDKKICFLAETHVEPALRAWFGREHLSFVPFPFQEEGEMEAAFVTGNCSALAGDLTRLAFIRLNFGPLAVRYSLLPPDAPVQVSSDPLAAASTSDDPAFANVVRWTFEVLLNAEAAGLTQRSVSLVPSAPTDDSEVSILTGATREIGSKLHLRDIWATDVIGAVGNYGEVFDRDLGSQSPLRLPRGQNRLSTEGGLILPLPMK